MCFINQKQKKQQLKLNEMNESVRFKNVKRKTKWSMHQNTITFHYFIFIVIYFMMIEMSKFVYHH